MENESKVEQLRRLAEATRAAKNSLGLESKRGEAVRSNPCNDSGSARSVAAPVSSPGEAKPAKRGRGRPKIEEARPWEAEGVSRRTWYRRQQAIINKVE